ncbi:MAG: C40 family peptidase [Oscillospiraceae bacterium]|nr:C40 family peptidase [Oscillospiraceae bacterium]
MKAIVNVTVCPMYNFPSRENTVEDEVLYGMVVDILEEPAPGWYKIRTHYRYEGIVAGENLILDQQAVDTWEAMPKQVVRNKNNCDVLSIPKVQGWHLQHLTRGCLITPVGEKEGGYQKVQLADGRQGYVMAGILDTYYTEPASDDEATMRKHLVDAAMLYQGTHYRWGGKSPLGIDCSGLCSMAYMLCGVLIYRDAKIVEGFPLHTIELADIKPGDLLFWPGHVGMYLGDDRYCHSTAKAGSDGFVINSLNPEHPDYREDLKNSITQVGSIF